MVDDGMMLDHLRTSGMLFRRGIIAPSTAPITITVDAPFTAGNYNQLMRGKYVLRPGWQNVHAVRKAFGPAPATQAKAPWFTEEVAPVIVSDTGQIIKDIPKQQLVVTAPQAEAFSGTLGETPSTLKHLRLDGKGFATVIAVTDDQRDLGASERLILSRTALDQAGIDTASISVALAGMKQDVTRRWYFRVTRPERSSGNGAKELSADRAGILLLPETDWHEGELELR
jgi:hypothetical protein